MLIKPLGVPTSAGAFAPSQNRAPAALRDARLLERAEPRGRRGDREGDRRPGRAGFRDGGFAERVEGLAMHLDVDTIDFTDAPFPENTGSNEGSPSTPR